MAIDTLFDRASSVMTVISFITFAGILWWALIHNKEADFAQASSMPFDDENDENDENNENNKDHEGRGRSHG